MALEMEDDVLFADLSKQIALLIMDDDEEDDEFPVRGPPLHLQDYHRFPQATMHPLYAYETSYRRESKGTGVFIPRSSLPRKKKRSGKSSSNNNSSQRQSGVTVNSHLQSNYYAKTRA